MKTKIYSVLLSFLLIIGCQTNKNNRRSENIQAAKTLEIDIDKSQCLRFSEVFDKPDFVPLETNIYNLFSNPYQTVVTDSNIFIVSRDTRYQILIFDRSGKFLNSIYKVGRGPDEYFAFGYIDVNELKKTITIFDILSRTFITMNFKGDFIKKIPAKTFYAYNFLIQSDTDKIIVDLSNSGFVDKPNNTNIFHVLYFDPVSGAVKTFLPMNRVGIFLTENSLYRFNGNIFYNPPIMDTIYQVNKESLTPRYILDFKKHSKDPEVFNTKDPVKYKSFEKNGTIWEHYDFKETERYIYSMYYAIGQKWYFHVFNKKTGKSIVYNKVINDYFGQTQAKDMFFFDFPVALYKDRIVLLYQPTQILKDFNSLKKTLSKEQFEKFKQQNLQLVNMIENLKKEDNPVLGFYKFK